MSNTFRAAEWENKRKSVTERVMSVLLRKFELTASKVMNKS